MSGFRVGSGYIGSSDILVTSQTNTEIIPIEPKSIPYSKCHCYKFSFIAQQPCHFVINGTTRLFREANVGFETDSIDAEIYSFVIEESGVNYQFTGAY